MDLPTCPSCGQSVIDDDAEDCPFCGASMSGKPSASGAAAKSAATKPAAKPAVEPATKPVSKAGATPPAGPARSDDPFDVQAEKVSRAIRLHPQPKPGRQWKVVCPMCETPGFTAPQAAGKPVRCVNPNCLMPVFTAPEPEVEKPAEEPAEAGGLSRGMMAALGVLLLAGVGFAAWYFFLREDPDAQLAELGKPAITDAELQRRAQARQQAVNPNSDPQVGTATDVPPEAKPPEPSELAPQAIPQMQKWAAFGGQLGPRDRPLSNQWIASAQVELGDVDGARQTLEQIATTQGARPANRVIPLVDLAWRQLASGQSADETVATALELAADVRGTDQLDWQAQTGLAAVLVALGRGGEAGPLLERPATTSAGQRQLWADLQAVRLDGTHDLTLADEHGPPLPPERSDWGAVALAAVLHGRAAEALQWANAAPDLQVRSDALADWAEAVAAASVRDGGSVDLKPLEAALSDLTGDERTAIIARAEARVARRLFVASGKKAAEPWIADARLRIAALPDPQPRETPGLRAVYDLGSRLPWRGPLRLIVSAAAEMAHAHLLMGDATAAAETFEKALSALDAIAPPTNALKTLVDQANFVEDELAQELNLSNADQIRQEMNRYTRNALRLRKAGAERDAVRVDLLQQAALWGLGGALEAAGQPALAATPTVEFRQEIGGLLGGTPVQVDEIARRINARAESGRGVPDYAVSRVALEAACQLVRQGQVEPAFSLLGALNNEYWAADAAILSAALACRNGEGHRVWELLQGTSLETMTKLAGYRGFVAGAGPPAPNPPASSPDAAKADGD